MKKLKKAPKKAGGLLGLSEFDREILQFGHPLIRGIAEDNEQYCQQIINQYGDEFLKWWRSDEPYSAISGSDRLEHIKELTPAGRKKWLPFWVDK